MGYNRSDFPESEQYYSEAISIPMYPSLTEEEQQEVVHRLITPIGHQTLF
ncbi:DegT/DnrJ/EryC1/StrS aminotransferase domain protein [Leptospira interrogans serovar Grippotyphosa str. LT2186]|nr:DegT/DnrJ/EryC1/StrS aminotransferase domain protein [Leptospira interrogans serovar Grippotyphosa str. LT2186]